ncbi:excinuclease ABC subunit UvrA [Candidatus Phytoplasma sacchari]|uniref:UvrABC system protein A n=1 Tax=Candidatus Phytoplasma sacchari TaxID=2609813 RepID=A0ABY7M0U0_9MOLU|nr:excinuclease ABC subunit UvrA [Candidatus Phytoplasma sacchari]
MKKIKNEIISIKGARTNNLKNINIDIPKFKFIVVSGISGSGKSSLVFDTIYQEGKRRYIESLSTYERQFLGNFEKPDVDEIEGLCPSISVEQKTVYNNFRSTVGTITEIYDYLRLIYSNISLPYDPLTNLPLKIKSIEEICLEILKLTNNKKIFIMSPIIENEKGEHQEILKNLIKEGFNRFFINQKIFSFENFFPSLKDNVKNDIYVIIDRFSKVSSEIKNRLYNSLKLSFSLSKNKVFVLIDEKKILKFYLDSSNVNIDFKIPKKEMRLFSFNTPYGGACPFCKGLGFKNKFLSELILDLNKSITEGGIIPYKRYKKIFYQIDNLEEFCFKKKININIQLKKLSSQDIDILLYGNYKNDDVKIKNNKENHILKEKNNLFRGIIPTLEYVIQKVHPNDYIMIWLKKFMSEKRCDYCLGARLNKGSLIFKINDKNIYELTELTIDKLLDFIDNLKLTQEEKKISFSAFQEVYQRLTFIKNMGLGYLTLSRRGNSLSGGESQRIKLAKQIGSKLSGVLYALDEPSIGLHQKDNYNLILALKKIKEFGNTLLVVEHDHETMLSADYLIDIGPLAGNNGGKIVAFGTPSEVMKISSSITGQYLSGFKKINIPDLRNNIDPKKIIQVKNACKNNLKNINVNFPLGVFIVVTGVSGSGKSTLVNKILLKGLKKKNILYSKIQNLVIDEYNFINKIIEISQSPIGKNPRSNPITYTGIFDKIREIFVNLHESKIRGYQKGHFSFNVKNGRCEFCFGEGIKKVYMYFLPDVLIKCEKCKGKKFNKEVLEIKYKDKNIYDILNMTVDEAYIFFQNHLKIKKYLKILKEVGLGYIYLGQNSDTLSGGEAQKIKLAVELNKKISPNNLYIFDEPTIGLHTEDIKKLIEIIHRITKKKATIITIEHNLDIIKNADYIIDLGPGGGEDGGNIIAQGTPEEIINIKESYTGQYLKKILKI